MQEPGFTAISEARVTELARQISHASALGGPAGLSRVSTAKTLVDVNPFAIDPNTHPELDPSSPKFNARQWVKTLVHHHTSHSGEVLKAGFSFRNLNVHGFGTPTDFQKDVLNIFYGIPDMIRDVIGGGGASSRKTKIQILRDFEGVLNAGEMLVVLGRPGSGCSTFLKTIAGETHGFHVGDGSVVNYQGIPPEAMHSRFRGEVVYQAETDVHFPQLTVGDTLKFAAEARAPRVRPFDVPREQYAEHMRDVIMAVFGLSHTINTKVGNDFIRGVSGGERKRVSIAEVALAGAPLQCWDNSTRGLDSATALEFVKTLRMNTDLAGSTCCLAIYQAPQAAYDIFDKVIVLYEGRQIYFGRATEARQYFENMGWQCPARSTTADFLTSLTNPAERTPQLGFENKVPRTPDEFAARWRDSQDRQRLLLEIEAFEKEFPFDGTREEEFRNIRSTQQAKGANPRSPYTLSVPGQIKLCMGRGFKRLRGDMSMTLSGAIGNSIMALIIGSVFYNLPKDTSSFFSRGALLFFAVLLNAFSSALEILTLYAQRPIVEKHAKYAFYHPFAEAISSMIVDMPAKIITAITFNLTLYFMTNLRREVDAFFIFLLFSFVCTLTMSNIFRTIASISRSLSEAMPLAAIFILALIVYTGFTIPTRDMMVYARWINYVNPIGYAFESLMVNEFSGQNYPCMSYVPSSLDGALPEYDMPGNSLSHICSYTGSVPGQTYISGDAFIEASYNYRHSHLWRNLGIEFAFMGFFLFTYLFATEYISAARSKGEVLVFRRGRVSAGPKDIESASREKFPVNSAAPSMNPTEISAVIQKQTSIFHWEDVVYDIKIKKEDRRLLDHVDGWVKPGTLTALMGVSGAGKTTLLDVLANRVTMGVVTGNMCVDGQPRDGSFQRKTGYVQQQDLHLSTSTVREALQFSASLRQPASVSKEEKMAYVEEIIDLLEMGGYADAVVGVPGEGLNVEQRKRLTIAVELTAKPELLLFLDEPTSGLDSQTAWSICALMRKLANNGQAILCTIHQPSAILMQEFDRLLFLASGGRTVYFGPIGENSNILTSYFEKNGAHHCPPEANPAEWMLEVIGAAPGHSTDKDWHAIWNNSPEKAAVKAELKQMEIELSKQPRAPSVAGTSEFAVPFREQLFVCTKRVFEQYWRTPSYIWSKAFLCTVTALFIGFSFFMANNSLQGMQNQMFAIFMLLTIFGNLSQQMMPHFVTQRSLYEVRERPSKTYSWQAFMCANIIVEVPWQTLMAVFTFVSWYYPIGLYRNAQPTDTLNERSGLMFLLILAFYLWTSTFSQMLVAGMDTAETAGNIGQLLFSLCLIFCGVLAGPSVFPRFWIFLYRVSPFTYLVSAMLSTGLAGTTVECSSIEVLKFQPPSGMDCGTFMANYTLAAGGRVYNPDATSDCQFCTITDTDTFLKAVSADYSVRWRNFGLLLVYIAVNTAGALFFYWLARVPKKSDKKVKKA
ncbi:ABC-2 type transporter-domain-containing protein [Sphaerosporella brunnea]|uniref:ABC-2 type transporter-domain-containing protein n=1 Tax=Sphaerosporella brunnea TaxID=1250544 RepID=A0A5J5ERW3_9PEZI|nr:ABC-2 type transporter-domain-containing protein [Sphaerosporella brunnea]